MSPSYIITPFFEDWERVQAIIDTCKKSTALEHPYILDTVQRHFPNKQQQTYCMVSEGTPSSVHQDGEGETIIITPPGMAGTCLWKDQRTGRAHLDWAVHQHLKEDWSRKAFVPTHSLLPLPNTAHVINSRQFHSAGPALGKRKVLVSFLS